MPTAISWRVLLVNFSRLFGMIGTVLMFTNLIDVCPYDRAQQ